MTTCRGCGRPLAHDHEFQDLFCGPCLRSRRGYDPHHDPAFADRLLALLLANRRRSVNVYRELGITSCGAAGWGCVKNHIERFRRHGHRIIGCHDGTYTYLGRRARAGKCRRRRRPKRAG